ncbi:putative Cyclin, N-terminal domain-containing protein [Balamuthia mandrillaris]
MKCGHAAKERKDGLAARCSSNKRKREGACQCWLQLQEQQRSNEGGVNAQDENAPFAMAYLKSSWRKDEAAYGDAPSPQENCLLMNGPSKKKARKLTLAEKQEDLCKETQQRVEAVSRPVTSCSFSLLASSSFSSSSTSASSPSCSSCPCSASSSPSCCSSTSTSTSTSASTSTSNSSSSSSSSSCSCSCSSCSSCSSSSSSCSSCSSSSTSAAASASASLSFCSASSSSSRWSGCCGVSRNGRGLPRANKRKLQDKKKEEDSPIHKLNDSLLLNVFSKLPRRSDLNAVNQVCQRWRMVVTSPSLWRCQRCKGPIVRGLRRCFNYVAEEGRHEIDVFHDRTLECGWVCPSCSEVCWRCGRCYCIPCSNAQKNNNHKMEKQGCTTESQPECRKHTCQQCILDCSSSASSSSSSSSASSFGSCSFSSSSS